MKTKLKQIAARYFASWWMPVCMAIAVLIVLVAPGFIHLKPVDYVVNSLIFMFIASIIGILVASIVNFARKRWLFGILNLLFLPAIIVVSAIAIMMTSFMGPSEDGFAKNLTIPKNIEISEPEKYHDDLQDQGIPTPSSKDGFQCQLMNALRNRGNNDPTVIANVSSLARLHKYHPLTLRRYLACGPSWRVFEENGSIFATRRWFFGPHWHYELHGYYSNQLFQSRTTIGLSGKQWAGSMRDSTSFMPGETKNSI